MSLGVWNDNWGKCDGATIADLLDCNFVWPDPGGACWECWKCEPCCGSPCNPLDGLYCFLCWWCCSCCTFAKLIAYKQDQDCALVNHCLPVCLQFMPFVGWIVSAFLHTTMRHELRMGAGAGAEPAWIGDAIMAIVPCTSPCSMCQGLRTVPIESWDWLRHLKDKGVTPIIDPIIYRPFLLPPGEAPPPAAAAAAAPAVDDTPK